MTSPASRPRSAFSRLSGSLGAAVPGLAVALGCMVGLRSVVAQDGAGLRVLLELPPVAAESLGLSWSGSVRFVGELQMAALERLAGLLAGLFLVAASVAVLNAVTLLLEAGVARRREMAVRAALGAPPGTLLRTLLSDARRTLVVGTVLGLLLGITGGGALRGFWPGLLGAPGLMAATGQILLATAVLLSVSVVAYAGVVLEVSRRGGLGAPLAVGGRASADRRSVFLRRVMAVAQMSAAGTGLAASLALVLAVGVTAGGPARAGVQVLPVKAGAVTPDWADLLTDLEALPGVRRATLATPAAVVGLGVRDPVTAQCGECVRGLMYTPFLSAVADHHAVASGYFDTMDIAVVAGRGFTAADGPDTEPVALVNETFARSSFQDGDPVGRKIRVGSGMDAWYTVVGVVEDHAAPALGGDDIAREAVYLNATQLPVRAGDVLLQADEGAAEEAAALLTAAGVAPDPTRSLGSHMDGFAAPLRWTGALAAVLAALTLLLALQGARATTLQIVRRRIPELAVRRALGATGRRIVRLVVGGSLGVAAWGTAGTLFFGTFLVALLRKAGGGVPILGPLPYLAVAGVLTVSMLLASWRAATEAVAVEPGTVLE